MSSTLELLAKELAPLIERQKAASFGYDYSFGMKHDASGTPISTGYTHGPGGMLSFPGVDPVVFNATMGPTSMLGQLPTSGSRYTNPTYYTITGVLGDSGDEKEDVCDDAPTAGPMKACLTTSVFGRYERATPELELNRLGQVLDRADPMDLRLVGTPLQTSGPFAAGGFSGATPADIFTNEMSRRLWERNVSFWRLLSRQLWNGNPVNNSAGGGYKEMTSFSVLVNTGYVDAETGQRCYAVDSYLRSFGYRRIDGDPQATIAEVTNLYHQVKRKAEMSGLEPVRWVFAMRSAMFYELTAIWPCAYLSYRCNPNTGATEFIDAQDAVRFRDEMRNGRYLMVDGTRIEVILDDGIPELSGNDGGANFPNGCFSSDIYLIPMSVVGGQAVTFLEYFEQSNPAVNDAFGNMVLGRVEGAFLSWPRQTNQCFVIQSKIEPRLVLRTPWLAARLQNVVYCPIEHEAGSFPDDPYLKDGGRTYRTGPSYYNVWQQNR